MIQILLPAPENRRSGGTIYGVELIQTLKLLEHSVRTFWVEPGGLKNVAQQLESSEPVLLDGLVFHQNTADSDLLNQFQAIYLTHLPFWLEPGCLPSETAARKRNELAFMSTCEKVICTSEFIKKKLIDTGLPKSNIRVLTPKINGKPREAKCNSTPKKLLTVGSVHYGKGIELLIQSLSRLKDFSWELNIVGAYATSDSYYRNLLKRIQYHELGNRVNFIGELTREEVSHFYHRSDLLIHPSRFESYGMVIAESLEHGLPVLSSDAGALKDEFGKTPVRFFKSEDEKSLYENLRDLMHKEAFHKIVEDTLKNTIQFSDWNLEVKILYAELFR